MNLKKKKRDAAIAAALALVISLSGTFAWQSISQQALNEAIAPKNPGGRLHDDFSGWSETDTKDIYVENFGGKNIYARIRLDEYMEIGPDAGLKAGDVDPGKDKDVKIVGSAYNPAAKIDDVTTWTTHIPGTTPDIEPPKAPPTDPDDPGQHSFHDYWKWTMGGQAADNPEGSTVYMPTFNKNKDSLSADINGTLEGTNPGDDIYYDDYYEYTLGEKADRVRDEAKTTVNENGVTKEVYLVPDGAFYDKDDDNEVDERGKLPETDPMYGHDIYGNGGERDVNYQVNEETHSAKKTRSGKVMLMDEWKALTDEEKQNTYAWVYDTDGWAYWSQPIKPNTATGLLLDRIELIKDMEELWYYGINAVAQFITADSLGSEADQTGFYDAAAGLPPSEDALELLHFIGVKDPGAAGAAEVFTILAVNEEGEAVDMVRFGEEVTLYPGGTALFVSGRDDGEWIWTLEGNTSMDTRITAGGVLKLGPDETADYLFITVRAADNDNMVGTLLLEVVYPGREAVTYSAFITADGDVVIPGGNLTLYAELAGGDEGELLDQDFIWSLDVTGRTYQAGTLLIPSSNFAVLTVDPDESGLITVIAAPRDPGAYPDVTATFTVAVAAPETEPEVPETPPEGEDPTNPAPEGEDPTDPAPEGEDPTGPAPEGESPTGPDPEEESPAGPDPSEESPTDPGPSGEGPTDPEPVPEPEGAGPPSDPLDA